MLVWLSHRVIKDAWFVVATWAVLAVTLTAVALTSLGGPSLPERLHSAGTGVPGTQSAEGQQVMDSLSGDAVIVTLLVSNVDLTSTTQQDDIAAALGDARSELAQVVGADNVLDPFVIPGRLESQAGRSMVATSMDSFIITVTVNPNGSQVADPGDTRYASRVSSLVEEVTRRLEQVPDELSGVAPAATGTVSHEGLAEEELSSQTAHDAARAVLYAAPAILLLVILLLGGVLASTAPALGAVASVSGSLGVLYAASLVTELPSPTITTAVIVGLGLSTSYGVALTSRYREELLEQSRGGDKEQGTTDGVEPARRHRTGRRDPLITACLRATILSTGRAVVFSSLAVAVSLCGLYLLGNGTLRPVGLTGALVAPVAMTTSLTLVPAVLVLLGRRMAGRFPLERVPVLGQVLGRSGAAGRDDRLRAPARLLLTFPWAALVGGLLLVVVLALPLGGLQILSPREERLPPASDQRAYWEALSEEYPAAAEQDATLVLAGAGPRVTTFVKEEVAAVVGVREVVSLSTAGEYTVVYLDLEGEEWSTTAEDAVAAIQELDAPADLWVTGQAADQVDFRSSLLSHLPVALGAMVLVTGVLLFLLTGSLLAPFTTLAVGCLSTTASLGILTWVLQDGRGTRLLGTVAGPEATAVTVSAVLGLGLATSQGILLLDRITQLHGAGLDSAAAVEQGLRCSARTVLGSALVTATSFLGLVAGALPGSKETGLTVALIVMTDALLGRMLLVPAVMRILGRWSWWAPRWLAPASKEGTPPPPAAAALSATRRRTAEDTAAGDVGPDTSGVPAVPTAG